MVFLLPDITAIMTGGGYWAACHPVEASPIRILGCAVVHSSGRRVLVEGPWACLACNCQACVGSVACLVGRLGEAYAVRQTPQANQPGRDRPHHFRCRE